MLWVITSAAPSEVDRVKPKEKENQGKSVSTLIFCSTGFEEVENGNFPLAEETLLSAKGSWALITP